MQDDHRKPDLSLDRYRSYLLLLASAPSILKWQVLAS
jgi:hypothetical protein